MSKKKKKKKRDSKSTFDEFIKLHPDIHSTIESQMNIILAQGDDDDIDEWESDNTCLSDEFNDNKSSWDLSTAFYSPPDISEDEDSYYLEDKEILPPSNIDMSKIRSEKVFALDQLAFYVVRVGKLLATTGGKIFAYDTDIGCYRPVNEIEKLVAKILTPTIYFSYLSVKDIQDLCLRISWLPNANCDANAFNNIPEHFNISNGLLNYMTGELKEHSENNYFTYSINAEYLEDDSEIYCPVFEYFCQTSLAPLNPPDEETAQAIITEKRRLLLEFIGYICSDNNSGKCALFFKGEPDSGKSIMINFISMLFQPELISNIPLHKLADRFNKAELFGRKLNVAGEIQGKRLAEISIFKSITGGDAITAEFKGKDPFSFTPKCKLLFAGNALPGTTEADATKAFCNRLIVLLFNHSIPKDKQDKDLLNKLWLERNSIFTLAVEALRDLHLRNFRFTIPQESQIFLQSFVERGSSLQTFLRDCCIISPQYRVHNSVLVEAYKRYCKENSLEQYSKQKLYEMLSGIPGISMKRLRINGVSLQGHEGITLINESFCIGTLEHTP